MPGVIELRPGGRPEPEPAGASYTDWESVYQDNVVGIYQLAFRRVGNSGDAEDVAEEVRIRTLNTLQGVQSPRRFWLLSSDHRRCACRERPNE